ncbi:unnamed protein product [Heterobilharzia americana]|nr:unnamed protein product [Heterobilharzia americana]
MVWNGKALRNFDAFAKPLKDFRVKTLSGAIVSILSSFIIGILFTSELLSFMHPQSKQEIIVDVNRGEQMSIYLDITLNHIPCSLLRLDTMDTTGAQQLNVIHEMFKTSVSPDGTPFRIAFVILSMILQLSKRQKTLTTVVLVMEQLLLKESAAIHLHRGAYTCACIQSIGLVQFNVSHSIGTLRFGDSYPGQINPLDNAKMTIEKHSQMISYYLKLVPTMYSSEGILLTNQYSATWHSKEHKSFVHFLTNTCAIIGGVFTVASLLDAFIYQSSCVIRNRFNKT